MGGISSGGDEIYFKKARTYRGRCDICKKAIFPGQMYIDRIRIGGQITGRPGQAHRNCYWPLRSEKCKI